MGSFGLRLQFLSFYVNPKVRNSNLSNMFSSVNLIINKNPLDKSTNYNCDEAINVFFIVYKYLFS